MRVVKVIRNWRLILELGRVPAGSLDWRPPLMSDKEVRRKILETPEQWMAGIVFSDAGNMAESQ